IGSNIPQMLLFPRCSRLMRDTIAVRAGSTRAVLHPSKYFLTTSIFFASVAAMWAIAIVLAVLTPRREDRKSRARQPDKSAGGPSRRKRHAHDIVPSFVHRWCPIID